ncbi:short-chain-enoyl-CoA hydratase [Proteinivorax hydrogeniformans]|uniref:short-chain-enoyl-CoA hydratase n=1 Tax=Proteinivorax hydrogeniformans TaxID=1826727 RepID=A0AAU8HRQ8_9FIRM
MEFNNLIYQKQGEVGILSINRPKALNALNQELLSELNIAIEKITENADIKALLITGEGKSFVAGADISQMLDKSPEEARNFAVLGMDVFRKIELMEIPVIAAINGFALGGGCELALACDIRIASEKAKFGQPEVTLGITPGFGGTQRLPRTVGEAKAKELIFTGDMIDAETAQNIGLVNNVVEADALLEESLKMAKKIASYSSIPVKYSKAAINRGMQMDIDSAMELEKDLFALCFASEDQKEGMAAFVNKRKPEFKNK